MWLNRQMNLNRFLSRFAITSHANASNIQPTPGYPANAAQTIIYVSSGNNYYQYAT